jgi:hypothetical protein
MSKEKKDGESIAVFFAVILLIVVSVHWLFYTGLLDRSYIYDKETGTVISIFYKLNKLILVPKVFFVGFIAASVWVMPSLGRTKKYDNSQKTTFGLITLFFVILFLCPYLQIELIDIITYPVFLIGVIYFTSIYFSILKNNLKDDDSIFGISNVRKDDLSISIPCTTSVEIPNVFGSGTTKKVTKHELTLHNPNQAIRLNAGTGGGKTVAGQWFIKAFMEKGYCGVMYDFEGDYREFKEGNKENPLVNTRTAYTYLLEAWNRVEKDGLTSYSYPVTEDEKGNKCVEYVKTVRMKPVKFALINFVSPKHSVRINPFNKKYHTSLISLRNMVTIFLKAVDLELVKKTDFWAKNGISYTQAIAIRLWKSYPDKLTIPHVIQFLLTDYNTVLNWLADDPETEKQAATIMTSYNAGAESQLAGSTASGQAPVQQLYDPDLYWVLSPTEEEEFDLDVTNPDNPYLLSVSNVPQMSSAFSPVISVILNVNMMNMNMLGKRKSIWFADEFPTITLNPDEISKFIATARKKLVVMMTMTQSDKQEEDKYGKEKSLIIRDNQSNQFQGKTASDETAERWSKSLGKTKKVNQSQSTSSSGVSLSESSQFEDVLQARDVKGQQIGEFIGQVAGGDPPFFRLKFDYFDKKIVNELPIMNNIVDTGDKEMDDKIIAELIQDNFTRIGNEINEILAPFKDEDED